MALGGARAGLQIGSMRQRVTLSRPSYTTNDYGEQVAGTATTKTMWAQVTARQGAEGMVATSDQRMAQAYWEVRVRYQMRSYVTTTDTLTLADGRVLDIMSTGDPDGRRREWVVVGLEREA